MFNLLHDWMFRPKFLKWFLISSTVSMLFLIVAGLVYIGHWVGLY